LENNFRKKYLRSLPAVDQVLQSSVLLQLQKDYPQGIINNAAKEIVNSLRTGILQAETEEDIRDVDFHIEKLAGLTAEKVKETLRPNLQNVINATGIILHTNLGRSLLAERSIEAVKEVTRHFSNLEFELVTGERGSRYIHVEDLLCQLTGAEAAIVVNNNAAAVLLVLNTLAREREVIISRGQLVEIGGSFRIPEVMTQSGAHLVEVGTTNKTHLMDYQRAIGENTAMILKVHTSNYDIVGFTSQVSTSELVDLGEKYSLPVIEDLGSGVLIDLARYGLKGEPTVPESIGEGLDIVTFSGDKLLGGPQAGIIVGKKHYIEKIKKNQLTRALRIDKMTLAALEATLQLYLDEEKAMREIPTLKMLAMPLTEVEARAEDMTAYLKDNLIGKAQIRVIDGFSQVGGGAMPLEEIPTKLISLQPFRITTTEIAENLREEEIPVIARIHKNQVLIDLRTVREDETFLLRDSLVRVLKKV